MKKDSTLQQLRQTSPGAPAPSGFPIFTAPPDDGFSIHAAALNASGRIELIAFDTDGQLWQTRQAEIDFAMPSWSHWSRLGGPFGGHPALALGRDARMAAFVIGHDNNIWVRRQASTGTW